MVKIHISVTGVELLAHVQTLSPAVLLPSAQGKKGVKPITARRGHINPVSLASVCFNVEVTVFKTLFCSKTTAPGGPSLFTSGTHLPQPCMYLSVKRRVRSLTQPGCVFFFLSFRASGCTAASTASTRLSSSKYLPSATPHSSSPRMQIRCRLSRCIDAYL